MARLLIFDALAFVIPFLLYGAWLLMRRGTIGGRADWSFKVILGLSIAGVLVLAVALLAVTSFSGAPPGEAYRPATFQDGHIVGGGFEAQPAPEGAAEP